MSEQARCMWMRGGTSKGGYFLSADLPADRSKRDAFLLRIMGSPDTRQIDGMGGGDPLTSKVAVVKKSSRDGVDVDYLFLQVFVDRPMVSPAGNGGAISTRTFIPHRCHKAIGVLGAVSVATACLLKGSAAHDLASLGSGLERSLSIEHPTGEMTVVASMDESGAVARTAILRTARKLMDGFLFTG